MGFLTNQVAGREVQPGENRRETVGRSETSRTGYPNTGLRNQN
jgi:hypothetical protein